jgi:hypothetical protein
MYLNDQLSGDDDKVALCKSFGIDNPDVSRDLAGESYCFHYMVIV